MGSDTPRRSLASRPARARWAWPGWWSATACLLFGVALTTATAWAIVAYGRREPPTRTWHVRALPPGQTLANMEAVMGPMVVNPDLDWPRRVPASWPEVGDRLVFTAPGYTISITQSVPAPGGSCNVQQLTAGWPMRALMLERASDATGSILHGPWRLGIAVRKEPLPHSISQSGPLRLPLQPIWPGFALNTILYAAIPYTLITLTRTTRARRCRKRGRCPSCNYDLAGLATCPECGAAHLPG